MSFRYSIIIKLDALFSEDTLKLILDRGHQLNYVYYKFMDYEGQILDVQSAVNFCIKKEHEEDEPHSLTTKINNTYTNLDFIASNKQFSVMLTGISHEKIKKFINGIEDINIAEYAKSMLDLTQDFRILEMHVEKN